ALTLVGLAIWLILHTALVFSPGFAIDPVHPVMGLAGLPGVHLILALLGTAALCVIAALLTRLPMMDWLRWMGSQSLIVYVAFVLPMGIARTLLIKLGVDDASVLSVAIMAISIVSPLVLLWIVERIGFGKFLFERPAWAHLPGTQGARQGRDGAVVTPAE